MTPGHVVETKALLYDPITGMMAWDVHPYLECFSKDGLEVNFSHIRYMWFDGNYSCDCNRRGFIYRILGIECPYMHDPFDACGDDMIRLVELRVVVEDEDGRREVML